MLSNTMPRFDAEGGCNLLKGKAQKSFPLLTPDPKKTTRRSTSLSGGASMEKKYGAY